MKSPLLASGPLIAALVWTLALLINPGSFESISVLLIGLGIITMALVSVYGIVLSGGRWSRRLGMATVGATLTIAVLRPVDAAWLFGLTSSVVGGAGLYLPGVTDRVRKLPAAAGPPQRAVLLPLVLISVPFFLGVAWAANSAVLLVIGLSAPFAAFVYSRVVFGGLILVRLVWPALAIALAPLLGLPEALVSVTLGVLVAVLAWHSSVKTAFHPPVRTAISYPIPPELAPKEILDAADVDEKGRSR